nr:peptidylprolyl isomerase [Desulfatitalea tepidiphila]
MKAQIVERTAIRSFIEKEIVSKIQVSDEEANTFYKDNPNYFKRPEEVHAQHILIKSNKEDDEKKKEASRQELMKIKKRIDAGEDFGELAKAHSQCPSAQNGGDLGSFGRGKMVPAFEEVAFGLKADEVSDIVETQFGYHLIKVLEHRQASTVDLEEARPRIVANLRNQKIQSEVNTYVEKLRGEAKIETFLK